jgi:sulfatase modifying factor 1
MAPKNSAVLINAIARNNVRPFVRRGIRLGWAGGRLMTKGVKRKVLKAIVNITVAEREPRAEDTPGAPPENQVAGSVVFTPPNHTVSLGGAYRL